ncbi:hypothetical protein V6N13_054440 [Hibiscus sabdariffa]
MSRVIKKKIPMAWRGSGQGRQVITIYVNNIGENLHRKGLWLEFGRHGEVLDAFIANKRNKEGKKFGFVRTSNKADANRMIERLNNFRLFGSKITVSLARFQTRHSYWRRVSLGTRFDKQVIDVATNKEAKDRVNIPTYEKKEEPQGMGGTTENNEKRRRRIYGLVESESLWKLKNCLVGETANVCSVESIRARLIEWGMGDVKVRRLGGKSFILTIEDMELYRMLEDLHWSYLKEVFNSVRPWTESESNSHRATWIEITGVPLHCWNGTTFKRLAQLWGDFEAFGENLNCSVDCEKMKVLIVTNQEQSIREVVEMEVGNSIYVVRIVEMGFTDTSSKKVIIDKERNPQKQRKFSMSEDSSSSESRSPVNGDLKRSQEIEASLKTCNLGIHPNHEKEDVAMGNVSSREDRGEVGASHEMLVDDINKLNEMTGGQNVVNLKNSEINWAKNLFKNIRAQAEEGEVRVNEVGLENLVGKDPSALVRGETVIEETSLFPNPGKTPEIGNDPNEAIEGQNALADRNQEEKREAGLPIKIASEKAHQSEQGEDKPYSSSDREENWSKAERVFFPEIILEKSTKKRYGSLKQIQDKSISEMERKRRDRAIRREKYFGKGEEEPEVSGRSLSESDLINHKKTLLKRAKRTLALGKRLGVDIERNEEGVLNEIVRLESLN